jgi:hypothetical protein
VPVPAIDKPVCENVGSRGTRTHVSIRRDVSDRPDDAPIRADSEVISPIAADRARAFRVAPGLLTGLAHPRRGALPHSTQL